MAEITSGYSFDCATTKSNGGIKNLWLGNVSEIDGATIGTGLVSALDMATGKYFYEIDFIPKGAEHKETLTDRKNFFDAVLYDEMLSFELPHKGAATMVDYVNKLCGTCGMVAIYQDNNNIKWIVGLMEAVPSSDYALWVGGNEGGTNKEFSATATDTVTLKGQQPSKALVFTGTVPVSNS